MIISCVKLKKCTLKPHKAIYFHFFLYEWQTNTTKLETKNEQIKVKSLLSTSKSFYLFIYM